MNVGEIFYYICYYANTEHGNECTCSMKHHLRDVLYDNLFQLYNFSDFIDVLEQFSYKY